MLGVTVRRAWRKRAEWERTQNCKLNCQGAQSSVWLSMDEYVGKMGKKLKSTLSFLCFLRDIKTKKEGYNLVLQQRLLNLSYYLGPLFLIAEARGIQPRALPESQILLAFTMRTLLEKFSSEQG